MNVDAAQACDRLVGAFQGAARPREGIIPPELIQGSEHQPHFCLQADTGK
jgi:hypothetical protein